MIGPERDHHAHSIYPRPRHSNPEITRRPWQVCSCLTPTPAHLAPHLAPDPRAASTHRTSHVSLLHALVPLYPLAALAAEELVVLVLDIGS
jgi:hypothetical protein